MVVSQRDRSGTQSQVESESYESGLQSGDEIDESEAGVERSFVESNEVFFGGSDEVRSASKEIEESVFPEGSLERDTAVSGVFGDGTGEIVLVERV
jgi:hypothetical protein